MRTLKVWLVTGLALLASGCGYNRIQQQDEGGQGRLVRGGQPVSAPRRSGAESGQYGQGFCGAGAEGADRRHRGARARSARSRPRRSWSTIRRHSRNSRRRRASCTQALKSLIAVSENYPQLKSDANFRDLQAQLEGTENRITVARNRYIQAVQGLQRH